ncbi:MAG: 16S rRNA (cytosine(1402)-N(4))-methyltransferase RsmH [bacterium]|nr:16S rRNA (cytosine(1402)-N(4))-methyltransferase RsmH [bacterium]
MHEPVLLQETIDGLDLSEGDVVIDGTLGRAGHAMSALQRKRGIFLIGIDRDEDAIEESKRKFDEAGINPTNWKLFLGNFRDMDKFIREAGKDHADKIMLDLGLSSPHLDSSGRGFSFKKNEPLLMTMEKNPERDSFTASDIVNTWAEEDIANVLYAYGDERYSRRIAKAIVERRREKPIDMTDDLANIVSSSVPAIYRRGKIHPATRTFQALRIAVNDELGNLKSGLEIGLKSLKTGGRMAIISFHSLEDRIVKNFIKTAEKNGLGKSLTKKPIVPSAGEIAQNPRSRSAKLRIFIKQ